MRLTGSRTYYRPSPPKMPPGLVELIESLSKEVLKHNPTDVYGFCAGHMQHLLEIRDGPTRKTSKSLKEKISIAQEKVRQRAEKRRQQYDKDMLLAKQPPSNDANEQLISKNIVETQSLIEEGVSKNMQIPVHHEQLLQSSEVEIFHQSDAVNEIIEDNTQNDNINMGDNIKSMKMESEIAYAPMKEETEVKAKSEDEITTNELICQLNKHAVEVIDTADNISSEGNIRNITTETTAQNITENNTATENTDDHKNNVIEVQEQKSEININEQKNGSNNNNDKQTPGPTKEVIQIETNENSFNNSLNGPKLNMKAESATTTKTNQHLEVEHFDKYIKTMETESLPSSANDTQQDSNPIEQKRDLPLTIDKSGDYVSECPENDVVCPLNDFDTNISISRDNNSAESKAVSPKPTTEEKQEIKTVDITKADQSINMNKTVADDITALENSITEIQATDAKDGTVNGNEVTLHIKSPEDDEERSGLDVSFLGDEEITVHSDLKLDDVTDLYMKSSSVTSKEPDDASNKNEKQNTTLVETTHGATESSGHEDVGNNASKDTGDDDNKMDLETAAVTIQKVFRSFLFKSRASTFDDNVNDEENFLDEENEKKEENNYLISSAISMDRRPHGITRMDTVLQTVNEEKSLSLSTDDSSTLSSAATIIQAHVRGFLVRNRLNSNKTLSTNSFPASNSNDPSLTSLENDNDQQKNKTVLNIHIVPEGDNYLSRDESIITSIDLSLDGSPASSITLHPLGYDKSERRKQLKREDAIQSISPPSNNSGKLSEDVDSVREMLINDNGIAQQPVEQSNVTLKEVEDYTLVSGKAMSVERATESTDEVVIVTPNAEEKTDLETRKPLVKMSSDEMDVVTPFPSNDDTKSSESKLMHSGEFHDTVLPTRVSRSETTVVRGE